MDRAVARRRYRLLPAAAALGLGLLLSFTVWKAMPRGFSVETSALEIAAATRAEFRDELAMRASAEPLTSVLLDATEGGRVEAVLVKDGAMVKKGELLFRLDNPQVQQQILSRETEVAQQTANLVAMESSLESSRIDHERRVSALEYEATRHKKALARNERLQAQGFMSEAFVEEQRDATMQARRLLGEAWGAMAADLQMRAQAVSQMRQVLRRLRSGLELVRRGAVALSVSAPVDGRLTDFRLQEGESVKASDKLGRIDDPQRSKLVVRIDEFYLNRVSLGLRGRAAVDGRSLPFVVSRSNPQLKDGRFTAELQFDPPSAAVALQPGQSVDVTLTLGKPTPALVVPDGAFFRDTGGSWAYVLTEDGRYAERRAIRSGRRASGQIEILEGLQSGERLILSSYAAFGAAERLRLK